MIYDCTKSVTLTSISGREAFSRTLNSGSGVSRRTRAYHMTLQRDVLLHVRKHGFVERLTRPYLRNGCDC